MGLINVWHIVRRMWLAWPYHQTLIIDWNRGEKQKDIKKMRIRRTQKPGNFGRSILYAFTILGQPANQPTNISIAFPNKLYNFAKRID